MEKGIPYDSEAGRFLLASITSLMSACAYRQSGIIAKEIGAFEGFAENKEPFLEVIKKHSDANYKLRHKAIEHGLSTEIRDLASSIWLEVENLGLAYGYRNAQISVLAPELKMATTGVYMVEKRKKSSPTVIRLVQI
jgi:ribonucleoside-diphosphate reductase alpha chain